MNFYQEITLIRQAEINLNFLWSRLYTQLHLALVEQKDANGLVDIGVCFPGYKIGRNKSGEVFTTLGEKIRVFAPNGEILQQLNLDKWLERLTDYVHISSIKAVDQSKVTGYLRVCRYRPKPNIESLVRRYAKFKKVSEATALARYQNKQRNWQDYPYVRMKSLSRDREFSLCINQKLVPQDGNGKFTTYGLSADGGKGALPNW